MQNNQEQPQFPDRQPTKGNGADVAREAREDLLQPWMRLAERLSPLIGDSGFCALYGRTVQLAGGQFDWLPDSHSCKSIGHLFATLRERYGAVDPALAGIANAALLTTFTKLLTTLIGEALTNRLLCATAAGDQHENAQEHM
jgi:hypothetical protein